MYAKGKRVLNPIIDWTDEDIWEYIKSRGLEYCKLYDEGWHRIGCIGCPMAGPGRLKEFEKYPKYYEAYFRAVERFNIKYLDRCKKRNKKPFRSTAKEWMEWWLEIEPKVNKQTEGQISLEEYLGDMEEY